MNPKTTGLFLISITYSLIGLALMSWYTYALVEESSWDAEKCISFVALWTAYGSWLVFVCFIVKQTIEDKFSRTMVTIKPDGDQENPEVIIHYYYGPFNRPVTHV